MREKLLQILYSVLDVANNVLKLILKVIKEWCLKKERENEALQKELQQNAMHFMYTSYCRKYMQAGKQLLYCIKDNPRTCGLSSSTSIRGIYPSTENRVHQYTDYLVFTYSVPRYHSDLYGGGMQPVQTTPVPNKRIRECLQKRLPNYLEEENIRLLDVCVNSDPDDVNDDERVFIHLKVILILQEVPNVYY